MGIENRDPLNPDQELPYGGENTKGPITDQFKALLQEYQKNPKVGADNILIFYEKTDYLPARIKLAEIWGVNPESEEFGKRIEEELGNIGKEK